MSDTTVYFNERFFDEILRSQGVEDLCGQVAQDVLAEAKANAPVDSGDYRDGLLIEKKQATHRTVFRVVGIDWKTLLVEAKTGNLARALGRARR